MRNSSAPCLLQSPAGKDTFLGGWRQFAEEDGVEGGLRGGEGIQREGWGSGCCPPALGALTRRGGNGEDPRLVVQAVEQ